MEEGRDGEDDNRRCESRVARGDHGKVDVAFEECINGRVPGLPVHAHRSGVPPGEVEATVTEIEDLGEGVEECVEEGVEHEKPNDDGCGREFEDTFEEATKGQFVKSTDRVLEGWGGVLFDEEVHHSEAGDNLKDALEEERGAEDGRARVRGLITEGRGEVEVSNVSWGDILRVVDFILISASVFLGILLDGDGLDDSGSGGQGGGSGGAVRGSVGGGDGIVMDLCQVRGRLFSRRGILDVCIAEILVDEGKGNHLEEEDQTGHQTTHRQEGVEDHKVRHERRPTENQRDVRKVEPAHCLSVLLDLLLQC